MSPFHDIPLYASADGAVLNMVVEIPRWTNAKMEVYRSKGAGNSMQEGEGRGTLDVHAHTHTHTCIGTFSCTYTLRHYCTAIGFTLADQRGEFSKPHQTGHQEGEAPIRFKLLPVPWIHMELWGTSTGDEDRLVPSVYVYGHWSCTCITLTL